jgi:NOL1/NOP2/sun family putative RNA methylase
VRPSRNQNITNVIQMDGRNDIPFRSSILYNGEKDRQDVFFTDPDCGRPAGCDENYGMALMKNSDLNQKNSQTAYQPDLPEAFVGNMRRLLGDSYEDFLSSLGEGRRNALRVNRLRLSADSFESIAPFPVKRVPWTQNGYYVDYRDRPSQHPWYRAGVYYLQEPSAMAPAEILPVMPGDRVLDLCAAPGGKATQLGDRLCGRGLLVANEISPSRVRALERNMELFGISNCVVTNEPPSRLTSRFPEYFDKILVDAPCSGEGMFRKDPEAVKTWSLEKVEACVKIQREIILEAADMLRPGGFMVYSTCTFEPEEDELAVAYLLRERPQMELLEIPCTEGRQTFSPAFSLPYLAERGFVTKEPEQGQTAARWMDGASVPPAGKLPDTGKAVRIWPHMAQGEGHFIALLRKQGGSSGENPSRTSGKNSSRAAADRTKPEAARQFLAVYAPEMDVDLRRIENRNGHLYLMPEGCPELRGLKFLRAGLYLGELKKDRFEPSQELALAISQRVQTLPEPQEGASAARTQMSLSAGESFKVSGIIDDGIRIMIPSSDQTLKAFLRGEAVRLEHPSENGWRLVCADVFPVGWGKMVNGTLKNHIPPAWRDRNGSERSGR